MSTVGSRMSKSRIGTRVWQPRYLIAMGGLAMEPHNAVMSYPSLLPDSNSQQAYVTFSVPSYKVARKIIQHSENNENLRLQISGKILGKLLTELAMIFERCDIETFLIERHHELRVRLFAPVNLPLGTSLCRTLSTSMSDHQVPESNSIIRRPSPSEQSAGLGDTRLGFKSAREFCGWTRARFGVKFKAMIRSHLDTVHEEVSES
ncbi:hypothetical protein P171DRAFT_502264 [Karstenula rhodostoma CBS 690.94]|uniref:Uncharacterized protein n=1 Tax=Karstenula rhodostoma CBS 690.94 TaxID=1392251 RepID=A0A9P4P677_9PLEO|nr:hypothetical protein P171DRAFT_502264 [Karstenula rhodostoma CBS 690.94]